MKSPPDQTTQILLLGGDVRSNMGDRAIRQSLIQMIRRVKPDAVIHALSKMPERDQREFGIHVVGKNFLSFFTGCNRLHRMDLAIWGGGQLLQDDTSLAKNIYWAVILIWISRILRIPIIGLGVGIGPLNTGAGKYFARKALNNLSEFVGRDPQTCEWARKLGSGQLNVKQAPDLALYLEPASPEDAWNYLSTVEDIKLGDDEVIVGVAVRRWFHLKQNQIIPYEWYSMFGRKEKKENRQFETFLSNLSEALKQFGQNRKVRLLFFPMSQQEWEGDALFSHQVAEASGLPAHILKLACDASMVKALSGLCDIFVSVRMHSAILAMSMGVPAAGIVHVPKTSYFYHLLGQDEFLLSMETAAEQGGSDSLNELLEKTFLQREDLASVLQGRLEILNENQSLYRDVLKKYFIAS